MVVRGISADLNTVAIRGVPDNGIVSLPLPQAERVEISVLDRIERESEAVEVPR